MTPGVFSAGRGDTHRGGPEPRKRRPASFAPAWRRIVAYLIDCLLIDAYLMLFSTVMWAAAAAGEPIWSTPSSPLAGQAVLIAVLTWPALFYLALTEASRWQATVGKKLLGLRVERSAGGGRARLWQTLLRAFLKLFVPWELAHFVVHQVGARVTEEMDQGVSLSEAVGRVQLTLTEKGILAVTFLLLGCYIAGLFTRAGRTLYDRAAGTAVTWTGAGLF